MADVLVVGFIVAFFLLTVLFVKACERIVGTEAQQEPIRGEAAAEPRAA